MYQEDWLMRQIYLMIAGIRRIVFGDEDIIYKTTDKMGIEETSLLHKEILGLLQTLKINEAENLLFEEMKSNDAEYLDVVLDFYAKLNELSDEDLHKGDFTRDEIKLGLEDALKEYGINILDLYNDPTFSG